MLDDIAQIINKYNKQQWYQNAPLRHSYVYLKWIW